MARKITANFPSTELDLPRRSSHYRFTTNSRSDEKLMVLRKRVAERNKVRHDRYVKLHGKNAAGQYVNRLRDAVEFDVYVYSK